MPTQFLCQTTDPFTETFDKQNFDAKHNHPIVPETRFYGVILVAICLMVCLLAMLSRGSRDLRKIEDQTNDL